jgi:hypothetical protein
MQIARTVGVERHCGETMSLDDFPRVPLMFGPSPIHRLPRRSAALTKGCETLVSLGGPRASLRSEAERTAGSWLQMAVRRAHAIVARTPLVFALYLVEASQPAAPNNP